MTFVYLHLKIFTFNYCIIVIFFLDFLKFIFIMFWGTTVKTSMLLCAIVCISSVKNIYTYVLISLFVFAYSVFVCIYYNGLPNKLTHALP